MEKQIKLNLIDNDKIVYTVNAKYNLDNDNIEFQHPLTGQYNSNILDVLVGWSEIDTTENINRNILVDLIQADTDILQKAFDLDNINYYI